MPNTNNPLPDDIDTLRWAHLTNRKDMILTCVHNDSNIDSWLEKYRAKMADDFLYYMPELPNHTLSRDTSIFKTVLKEHDYCAVISHINIKNKFSKWYYDCTGIVAIGRDKETGENISFLTHQNPMYLEGGAPKESFSHAVTTALEALREKSVQWSIDIVILWGLGYLTSSEDKNLAERNFRRYTKVIEWLNDIIFNVMKFYPVAVCSPLVFPSNNGSKDIFIDTQKRQIHFWKPTRKGNCNVSYITDKVNEALDQIRDE